MNIIFRISLFFILSFFLVPYGIAGGDCPDEHDDLAEKPALLHALYQQFGKQADEGCTGHVCHYGHTVYLGIMTTDGDLTQFAKVFHPREAKPVLHLLAGHNSVSSQKLHDLVSVAFTGAVAKQEAVWKAAQYELSDLD